MVFPKLVFGLLFIMSSRAAATQAVLDADDEVHDLNAIPLPVNLSDFDDGLGFRRYLLSGFKRGVFTAKDVCCMAFHAQNGGCHGISDLALHPESTGGNFYTHLQRQLELRSIDSFYAAKIPLWCNATQERILEDFPMHLPHQLFSELYKTNPALFDPINIDVTELPPMWLNHAVYAANGDKAIPVSLYSDGVPHSKTDSFYVYYFKLVHSSERHMICAVRRVDLCRCGCRGMCTFGSIGRILSWSLNVLAGGKWPSWDHLGRPLRSPCGPLAGGCVGGLTEYRADLLEFVSAFGFKSWSNCLNPCFMCGASRDALFEFPDCVDNCVWPLRDATAYNIMVQRSIKRVRIPNGGALRRPQSKMEWNPDLGGLVLSSDHGELHLKKGWRLMEDGAVVDLHDLQSIRLPSTFTFFDTANAMGLNFVSPLFNVVGFTIECLCLDLMHVFDLGICQHLCGTVLRHLVCSNFAGSKNRRASVRRHQNIIELRRMWCRNKPMGKFSGRFFATHKKCSQACVSLFVVCGCCVIALRSLYRFARPARWGCGMIPRTPNFLLVGLFRPEGE